MTSEFRCVVTMYRYRDPMIGSPSINDTVNSMGNPLINDTVSYSFSLDQTELSSTLVEGEPAVVWVLFLPLYIVDNTLSSSRCHPSYAASRI